MKTVMPGENGAILKLFHDKVLNLTQQRAFKKDLLGNSTVPGGCSTARPDRNRLRAWVRTDSPGLENE